MSSWHEFLHEAAPAEHAVQVYDAFEEIAGSVAEYLGRGLDAGIPSLVVATPEHREAFGGALAARGCDTDAAIADGRLVVLDADGLLDSFLVDGTPDPRRFERTVGALLDDLGARGRPVRVYGEMVQLLCERGRHAAALLLEGLWNELAYRRTFSLLCGYHRNAVDPALEDVCALHTHVHAPAVA